MTLLLAAGLMLGRWGVLTAAGRRDLSALVVDVAFPALVLSQLPATVDAATLAVRWPVPLLGCVLIGLALLVGRIAAHASIGRQPGGVSNGSVGRQPGGVPNESVGRQPGGVPNESVGRQPVGVPTSRQPVGVSIATAGPQRRTLAFLVGTPNWIFFPLPLAQARYGAEGVQIVLLLNAGAQAALWSVGVATLRGAWDRAALVRGLWRNPGLWATALGLALAILRPEVPAGPLADVLPGAVEAVTRLGQLAVPLSFLLAGLQLATGVRVEAADRPVLLRLTLARLVAAPLLFAAVALPVLSAAGFPATSPVARVAVLVAAMPVAVTCGPLAERFGGDTTLAVQAIVYTTLAAALTVPVWIWAAG